MTRKSRACARCGYQRKEPRKTPLCGDCRYVLTPEEQKLWVETTEKKAA